jgi:hypothetical protein
MRRMQHRACNIQDCDRWHKTCSIYHATSNVQHTAFDIHHACNVHYATTTVLPGFLTLRCSDRSLSYWRR